MQRPFRFAVQSFSATGAGEWRDRARRIEDLGYEALHLAGCSAKKFYRL